MDLRNADVDEFVQHFQYLVGVGESNVSEECKSKKAWKIAEEWLRDKSRYEKEWKVDSGPPTWKEMKKAAAMRKPGKAINRRNPFLSLEKI